MKTLLTIDFKWQENEKHRCVFFGILDTSEERQKMHALRYQIYSEHDYIYAEDYPDKIEKDDLDRDGKCQYIIAKFEDNIIGSARIIKDDYLPIERECFAFKEPVAIANIPRSSRVEIGRLVASYRPTKNNNYIPRHLIMIGILKSIFLLTKEMNAKGGYAFIKKSAFNKLQYIGMPVKRIHPYKQIYRGRILEKYFNKKNDPVYPAYFIEKDIEFFFKKLFENGIIFSKNSNETYQFLGLNPLKLLIFRLSLKIR